MFANRSVLMKYARTPVQHWNDVIGSSPLLVSSCGEDRP